MLTPEFMAVIAQEKARQAAEFQRQAQALSPKGRSAPLRSVLSQPRFERLPGLSFVMRKLRTASVP